MNIIQSLAKKLVNYLVPPTKKQTAFNPRYEIPPMGNVMDADRVHGVIESARMGDTRYLFALYRDIVLMDSHLQAEFSKRKLAVLGDPLNILPIDKASEDDKSAAAMVKSMIESCPDWLMACSHLLDSTLWPVAVVEKVFRPADQNQNNGQSNAVADNVAPGRYELASLIPVPHQLLDFITGKLRIRDVDPDTGQPLATTHEVDPNRYIVHRGHLLSTPDCWGGPMRSLIFWWLLGAMDRDWWARFLDRYGSPFLLGRYETDDEPGRNILEQAFSYAVKIGGLVVTKDTEVEIKEAAAGNTGEAYEKFLTICQREKSKLILGQTLSAEAQPTGLNSGTSKGQEAVRQDVRRFDATLLGMTIRQQLASQILIINSMPGNAPSINWGTESVEDSKSLADLLVSLSQSGLQPTDESLGPLSERLGFQLERKAAGGFPGLPPLTALSASDLKNRTLAGHEAIDQIARAGSAGLAQAFRGRFAPIQRIVMESRSAAECESRIREFCADWKPGAVAALCGEALEAFAINGASANTIGKKGGP